MVSWVQKITKPKAPFSVELGKSCLEHQVTTKIAWLKSASQPLNQADESGLMQLPPTASFLTGGCWYRNLNLCSGKEAAVNVSISLTFTNHRQLKFGESTGSLLYREPYLPEELSCSKPLPLGLSAFSH